MINEPFSSPQSSVLRKFVVWVAVFNPPSYLPKGVKAAIIISQIGAWRSPASALAWGVRGPGFESQRPDFYKGCLLGDGPIFIMLR